MDILEKKNFLITNTLRDIFLFDIQKGLSPLNDAIITITNSFLVDKGKLIKVYLNLYRCNESGIGEKEFLKILKKNKGKIRFELGNRLSNKLKNIPDLEFFIDDTFEKMNKIRNVLKKIEKK